MHTIRAASLGDVVSSHAGFGEPAAYGMYHNVDPELVKNYISANNSIKTLKSLGAGEDEIKIARLKASDLKSQIQEQIDWNLQYDNSLREYGARYKQWEDENLQPLREQAEREAAIKKMKDEQSLIDQETSEAISREVAGSTSEAVDKTFNQNVTGITNAIADQVEQAAIKAENQAMSDFVTVYPYGEAGSSGSSGSSGGYGGGKKDKNKGWLQAYQQYKSNRYQIDQLKGQREEVLQEGKDTSAIEAQIKAYERLSHILKQVLNEQEKLVDPATRKALKKEADIQLKVVEASDKRKAFDRKNAAQVRASEKAEKEYNLLLRERNQLLGSNQGLEYALNNKGAMPGAGFRNRGAPLTKEQKQGYAEMIGINNEKLGSVNQRLAALRAGGLISDEALAKMDADAALNLRALQAQAKMNGGGGSGGGFLGGRTLVGSLKESLGNMVQWSLSISLAYKILGAFTKGLQKTIQAVQTMDSAMMNLRIVTGASKEDASALISGYAKLADQLSVTTSEVTQSAAAWMRQGYSIQETGELIKASMYLAKLGFTDVNTATSVLTNKLRLYIINYRGGYQNDTFY